MFSSRSIDKILDESDIELITIRILLLKIDLIFKCTLQSRMEAVKRLKQYLKTWSRRAELDSIYYTLTRLYFMNFSDVEKCSNQLYIFGFFLVFKV